MGDVARKLGTYHIIFLTVNNVKIVLFATNVLLTS